MSAFTASVILEGRSIPSPPPVRLHAGPLTMLLEPASGFLRQIRLDEAPVLNGIYAAVRDRNWGTVEPVIRDLRIDQQPQSFTVGFVAECRQGEIQFVWCGRIEGDVTGRVRYTFDGRADSGFLRNRVGFCVLHGVECAGRSCVIEHVDGTRAESSLPRLVEPHQPFKQIRAITHWLDNSGAGCEPGSTSQKRGRSLLTSATAVEVEVRLEGDVFEMEDQRNWTDASFKTYCTPLDLPFPVKVSAGQAFHQTVELRCRVVADDHPAAGHSALRLDDSGDRNVALPGELLFHPLPRLGLGMASHELPLNDREVELLKPLRLDHLRADITPLTEGWAARWHEAVRQAQALDCHLHVALHLEDRAEEQLSAMAAAARSEPVDAWLIFRQGEKVTSNRWTALARERLAPCGGRIVGGTNANFAELNRNRPTPGGADAITWSVNPQVHAFDNRSLVETLGAQWATVASAREWFPGDLMISPVTLRPRFNPNATGTPMDLPPDVLPPPVDVRQMSLFGAAWTLGSVASLCRAPGLRSVTYYETTGWRGIMEWAERPRLPHRFVTRPGWVFPMYFVFALLAGFKESCRTYVANPSRQVATLVRNPDQPASARLLAASFDPEATRIELPQGFAAERRLAIDLENAVAAMRDPTVLLADGWMPTARTREVLLPPGALVAIDGQLS